MKPTLVSFLPPRPCAFCLLLLLAAVFLPLTARAETPKPREIEKAIAEAKDKAAAGKAGLSKLTDRERQLNADLAAAEDRISKLERDLAKQESELEILESAQRDNLRSYDVLAAAKTQTETELLALLSFLWPLHNLQESVGMRDGVLWSDAEREYVWTAEIMRSIAEKQALLKENESALSSNLSQREVLSHELRNQVATIKADKDALLADTLKFNQELAAVRQEKQDLESTLVGINQTIESLNAQMEISSAELAAAEAARAENARAEAAKAEAAKAETAQTKPRSGEKSAGTGDGKPQTVAAAGSDKDTQSSSGKGAGSGSGTGGIAKGKTPWPANGKVVVRYAPGASPPVRGIGLSLSGKSEVKAVAWGKVVHSDVLRGLGYVVVLMHPKQYYTVYAHLTGSPYKVGQEVKQGAVLGKAGHYPPAGGPGLYFELRSHEKAVNPEAWLSKN